ncbi:hypothetical protein GC163_01150 [bacterium]|nr:hypothetical protein [bacterium]
MSFLSLAFLAALPLAATPLLLHWFDRHRNVTISWGAMQFLVEAAQKRSRARRLQEWWLLALRMLAIACLVLALARPLAQTGWITASTQQETIFILDNSLSMQQRSGDTTAFEQARAELQRRIVALPADELWQVMTTAPYPQWVRPVDPPESTGRELADEETNDAPELWEQLQPTLARGDMLGSLLTAIQAEPEGTVHHRNIVILTDDQALDWQADDAAAWQQLADTIAASPLAIGIERVPVLASQGGTRNLAIQRVSTPRSVVGVHQPVTVTAIIENVGQSPMPACRLIWQLAEATLCTEQIPALEPQATHSVTCKLQLPDLGVHRLICQLDTTDDLPPDHRETLLIEVVDELPVLIVESARNQVDLQQDALFLLTALGWIDGVRIDSSSVFVPTVIDSEQLPRMDLSHYEVVVVPHLTSLEPTVVQQLTDYVREGGGLWLATGPRTDIDRFNQQFFAEQQGLSPLPLDRIVDLEEDDRQRVTLNPQLSTHPAVVPLADQRKLDTGDVAVSRHFRFLTKTDGQDVSTLLSLTQGEPIVVERQWGRGRVIVQGIPLRWEWSDLVRSQAFVVLVQEWLSYLSEPQMTRYNLSPGEPLSFRVNDATATQATLQLPTKGEIELTADVLPHANLFRTSRTLLPGDYALEFGLSGDVVPFHVRRDERESNLQTLTAEQSQELTQLTTQPQTPDRIASTTTVADPVWPLLWVLLIGAMVLELWLSHHMSRQRFGSTLSSDSSRVAALRDPRFTTITSGRTNRSPIVGPQTRTGMASRK